MTKSGGGEVAAEGDLDIGDFVAVVGDFAGGLDESAHASGDFHVDDDFLLRRDGSADFGGAHCGEAEIFEIVGVGVALCDAAGELGDGFDHQDAGHQWVAGEVSFEEMGVSWEGVTGGGGFSGFDVDEMVDEAELRAMR